MIRLPDAPAVYDPAWAASLVSALSQWAATFSAPQPLQRFAKAKLPSAKKYAGVLVYLNDPINDMHLVLSDGVAWRYPDGTLV